MSKKVIRICEICGKEFEVLRNKYNKLSSATCCSSECSHIKTRIKGKVTKLEKYGDENYNNTELRKKTNLKKYGVENVAELVSVQKKAKQTRIEKYDSYEDSSAKEKRKQTNLKNRGVEYNFQDIDGCMKYSRQRANETRIKNHTTMIELMQDEEFKSNHIIKTFESRKKHGKLSESSIEIEIRNFIENLGINTDKIITGKGETRFEVDIYIPDKNIGIEVNGAYFHAVNGPNGNKMKKRHQDKLKLASEKNIDLIQIWEDQWKNKQPIIEDILKARLGIIENKIYARKCEIKEISQEEYKSFCLKNHIQGYRAASVKLGLYYNNNLVQIASFNKCQKYGHRKIEYEWEWIRGCIASNNKVIGGTSKLLKYFVITYKPKSILCYADANLFNGKGYKEAGFQLINLTAPDKFYIENNSLKRIYRNPYKYKEHKLAVKEGKLFECYGAGNYKFIKLFN